MINIYTKKVLDILLNAKNFQSVGVTGFEPATTRPPGLKFNFAGKCNYLFYNGFIEYPVTCNLSLYGSISITHVPFVFQGIRKLYQLILYQIKFYSFNLEIILERIVF